MKIRNRITLWITSAGLFAALIFSIVIAIELLEQPFELLDRELDRQASTLLIGLSHQEKTKSSQVNYDMLESLGHLYWFKIFDQQNKIVYASSMTRVVDIPLRKDSTSYNIHTTVPLEFTSLDQQDESDEVTFRVRAYTVPFNGQQYFIQIARPMEKLWLEILELIISFGVGLIFFTLILILLGYFVAGKALEPVNKITILAKRISDRNLEERIPLGKNHDELYALSSNLNDMFDRLQLSFKLQKEFIANASHELKTPLSIQRLFFDEAIQHANLPKNFRTNLITQAGVNQSMTQLVKNLLDLSTLELEETLNLQCIDLTALTRSVFEEFGVSIQAADINLCLHIQENSELVADKEKIRRVLINLIDNAIKYNLEQGGEIRFNLERTASHIRMEIANTGQKIPNDELEKVFNQFHRVEKSRSKALGGSGLGLTIVKHIVERHNGTIKIENKNDPSGNWILVAIVFPIQQGL